MCIRDITEYVFACQLFFMITGQKFPIETSNLFKLHELEKKEIERIKWIESEKAGFDIGDRRADWIWWAFYRDNWRKGLRESGIL